MFKFKIDNFDLALKWLLCNYQMVGNHWRGAHYTEADVGISFNKLNKGWERGFLFNPYLEGQQKQCFSLRKKMGS